MQKFAFNSTGSGKVAAPKRGLARIHVQQNDDQENAGDTSNLPQAANQAVDDPASHAAGPSGQTEQEQQQQQPSMPKPDRRIDYQAWLAYQKQKWRHVRQDRKRRRVETSRQQQQQSTGPPQVCAALSSSTDVTNAYILQACINLPHICSFNNFNGMRCWLIAFVCGFQVGPAVNAGAYFRQQQTAAAHAHWQLLQLAPTSVPGTFKAWALVDNSLYAVPIRVPRTVYVNADVAPDDPAAAHLGTPTKVLLPHGDEARHVYEVRQEVQQV